MVDPHDLGRILSKYSSAEDSIFKKAFDKAGNGLAQASAAPSFNIGSPTFQGHEFNR